MKLLTFDPGRMTGWARFVDNQLVEAGTMKPYEHGVRAAFEDADVPDIADLVVIENPRWYPHKTKGDVNELLDLAVLVGQLEGFFEKTKVELVSPRTWKGTVPKEIHNRRVLAALRPEELAVLPKRPRAKDYDHNMTDAVGLGLWKLGRMR